MTTPYNNTETSQQRAQELDESGTAAEREQDILAYMVSRGAAGSTSKEYAVARGFRADGVPSWVTGAFSTLHKARKVTRLKERRPKGRGAAYVYVDNNHVNGRPVKEFKSNEGITDEDREAFRWYVDMIEDRGDRASANGRNLADRLKRFL
jgi:hypothetical protein